MSDYKFGMLIALVGCPIVFFSVLLWGGLGALSIMLVPVAFLVRQSRA